MKHLESKPCVPPLGANAKELDRRAATTKRRSPQWKKITCGNLNLFSFLICREHKQSKSRATRRICLRRTVHLQWQEHCQGMTASTCEPGVREGGLGCAGQHFWSQLVYAAKSTCGSQVTKRKPATLAAMYQWTGFSSRTEQGRLQLSKSGCKRTKPRTSNFHCG